MAEVIDLWQRRIERKRQQLREATSAHRKVRLLLCTMKRPKS